MDEYQIPKRTNKVERETGGTLFILPRPDGEGSFGCCTPPLPVRPWHAHNTHTQAQLPQLVCAAVVKASHVSQSLSFVSVFFGFFCQCLNLLMGLRGSLNRAQTKPFFVGILAALVYMSCSIYTESHRQKRSGWKLEHTWNYSLEINVQVKTSLYINPTRGRFACYFLCYNSTLT